MDRSRFGSQTNRLIVEFDRFGITAQAGHQRRLLVQWRRVVRDEFDDAVVACDRVVKASERHQRFGLDFERLRALWSLVEGVDGLLVPTLIVEVVAGSNDEIQVDLLFGHRFRLRDR